MCIARVSFFFVVKLNYIPNYQLIPTKLLHFSDKRPEQSIASARASVMIYDDLNKKWVPSGSSHGLSKVHIYHHFLNNTFRVVGRKLQDHEVNHNDTNVNIQCLTYSNIKSELNLVTFLLMNFRWS